MDNKEILLSAQNVKKQFSGVHGDSLVLDNISVDIYRSDFTVIMGSSGAGKSTLMYALSKMADVTEGKIIYEGEDITNYTEREIAKLRRKAFGFVFQSSNLVSNLSLMDNVLVAGYIREDSIEADVVDKARKLFSQMGISKVADQLPAQVSGGEMQRGAIVRAMINSPDILFADEPTGALNMKNTEDVMNILTKLNRAGQSILMVTHELRAAIRGNRILYMEDGKILDELTLPSFSQEDRKQREAQVSQWLHSMDW